MEPNKLPYIIAAEPFNLKDSDLITARLANESIQDVSWRAIVALAYKRAYDHFKQQSLKHLEIFETLWKISGYKVKSGEYNGGSFSYHSPIHASVQSRDADQSMTIVLRLARATGESFEIKLRLPRAAPKHGGQVAIIWWDDTADGKHHEEFFDI